MTLESPKNEEEFSFNPEEKEKSNNINLEFQICSITANKEANQFLFSKYFGQITGHFKSHNLKKIKEDLTMEMEGT